MAFKKHRSRGPRLPVPKERAPRGVVRPQAAPLAPPPGITPGPNDFSAADEQAMRRGARMANAGPPAPTSLPGDEGGEPIPS